MSSDTSTPSTTQGWRYRWVDPDPVETAADLSDTLGISALIARLLVRRGVGDATRGREFLEPGLGQLHDPVLLPGAERAADRLVEAVRGQQKIVIYGDYDVDGITATAILYHILKAADPRARVESYVPHRLDEGYGLNAEAIAGICDAGAELIVTVDCGITAHEPALVAAQRDVDLIITDHHQFADALPQAHTLVHPLLDDDAETPYPWPGLCGAGVAYKIAWQFARSWCNSQRVTAELRETLLDLLSLAALGTIADVVPLVDENRVIARHGLRRITRSPLVGINALLDHSGLRGETIDAYHVGFVIGPRLNAVGRLGHAREAIRLLTDAPPAEAGRIAERLNAVNEDRKARTRRTFEQASERVVAAGFDHEDSRAIVLEDESWHPGIVGIVCSRLVERFGRPAILLSVADGVAQGSARSIEGFDIHGALVACREHLGRFGGHAQAAGMRLPRENERFREAMLAFALANIAPDELMPTLRVDADLALDELDQHTVERMLDLAPFGRDNPKPLLRVNGASVKQPARAMGRDSRHMNVLVTQGGAALRCVGWSMGEIVPRLGAGTVVDLVGEPTINAWNGRRSVELVLRDLRWAAGPGEH